jgi:acyl carrier protein
LPAKEPTVHTLTEIQTEVTKFVSEIAGIPEADVEPHKHIVKEMGVDSLSMVEIMVAAEERFGVRIPDSELDGLPTIHAVTTFIHTQQG